MLRDGLNLYGVRASPSVFHCSLGLIIPAVHLGREHGQHALLVYHEAYWSRGSH